MAGTHIALVFQSKRSSVMHVSGKRVEPICYGSKGFKGFSSDWYATLKVFAIDASEVQCTNDDCLRHRALAPLPSHIYHSSKQGLVERRPDARLDNVRVQLHTLFDR